MKYSILLVTLVATLGLTACGKPLPPAPAYSGPDKVAYDAAVEQCKTAPFDSRAKCAKEIMAKHLNKK
jgi:lipopolysaccharide export system protein LptC